MQVRYAVTFEFMNRPPLTHRGTVAGSQVATCASRAIRMAQRALRPVNWSSLVFVALERLDRDAAPEGAALAEEAASREDEAVEV
jgi:hypothetical protein